MKKLVVCLGLITWGLLSSFSWADEPAEAFLEALREEGYFDMALEYLDSLESSDLVSEEFRQTLPFEKAQTLIASAAAMRDIEKIEQRLDDAQQLLTEFAQRDQSLETVAKTLRYQGNLLLGRAKVYASKAESDRLTASEKEEINTKVREMLQGSLNSYMEARSKIRSLIDPSSPDVIRIDVEDPSTTKRLQQFQAIYTQVRIRLPVVIEQLADTYPPNSPEAVKLYQDAADEYQDVYEDYRRYPAGLEACLFAGRCLQKLGKHQEALRQLEDIFDLSDSSTFKILKRRAFTLAADSWEKIDPYPATEVVARLEPTVAVLNRTEIRHPDWLRIQMELAKALHMKAAEVKAKGGPKSSSDSRALDRNAARIMRNVSRVPSIYRDRAKQLLSEWDISITETNDPNEQPPESFIDARQKARDLIADIESLLSESSVVKKKVATLTGQQKADAEQELEELESEIQQQSEDALGLLNLSLELADETTIRADLNNVRYMQSYCYFAMQLYYESALIGEFLLAKYPTVEGTRQSMTLMIQSYSVIHDQAPESEKPFAKKRLTDAAVAVMKRWPGSSEAGLAASTLTRMAMNEKDFASAEKYFAEIPQSSYNRGQLAARLGQRLWFDYKNRKQEGTDSDQLPKQLENARNYLKAGVENANTENLLYEEALASLLLVDAHLEADDVQEAVNRLEAAQIAPLDLVKQKHPAIMDSAIGNLFVRETYKIAIKTYLAAMRTGDHQKWIDKVSGILAAMREAMEASNDPDDRLQITNIYRLIASELKNQFELIDSADDKQKFATSLATFLGSIEKDSDDSKTVLWSGATLLSIAESLTELELDDAARPMFQQAVSALNRAETLGFEGDPQQEAMVAELKRQRALALRGSGKYEEAVASFVELLQPNPLSLKDQIYAAETLQMWAKSSKRSRVYAEAMMGTEPYTDPDTKRTSNLIWGWRKLVQATRTNPKFLETYYKSLYNLVVCRLEYGILEKSDKAISSSLKEIENAARRDASFGTPQWKEKFGQLKLRVQQNMEN